MTQFDVWHAKKHLWQLIEEAAVGEEVIITDGGVPVARLVAIQPRDSEASGAALASWFTTNPTTSDNAHANGAEIDVGITKERLAWD